MSYTPHTLVSFGGTLNTIQAQAPEIWQCGVRLGSGGVNDPTAYLSEIAGPLSAWFTGENYFPNTVTLDWVKANAIGADGKYASPVTNVHDYAPHVVGTGGPSLPDIITSAISWTTAYNRGPAHAGRIFLPLYGQPMPLQGSMTIGSTALTHMVATGKALLTVLANQGGTQHGIPSILSKINGGDRSITGVRVGNVLDVQRRRKDALKEVYTSANWP